VAVALWLNRNSDLIKLTPGSTKVTEIVKTRPINGLMKENENISPLQFPNLAIALTDILPPIILS
jgi:hypothetical protein